MSSPKILTLPKGRYFVTADNSGILTDETGAHSFGPNQIIAIKGEVRYFVKAKEEPLPRKAGYPRDRSKYADKEEGEYPVDSYARTRSAISYFHKHKFPSAELKKKTAREIMAAARKYGIKVAPDSDVARAAK
jgi:hypothetical protein